MKQKILTWIMLSVALSGCTQQHSTVATSANLPVTAVTDFKKAAELNVELGLTYLREGYPVRAKEKLNRAHQLAPQLPQVHYAMGYYLESTGETTQAKAAYQKAIKLNPQGGVEHNHYGAFLCRQQAYRASEVEFMRALEDPNYLDRAEAYENAGLCILEINDTTKAQYYFKKALDIDNRRPNALIELAYLAYQQQNIPLAQHYFNAYQANAPKTARSLGLGLKLAQQSGDQASAQVYQKQLQNHFPNSKESQLLKPNR